MRGVMRWAVAAVIVVSGGLLTGSLFTAGMDLSTELGLLAVIVLYVAACVGLFWWVTE